MKHPLPRVLCGVLAATAMLALGACASDQVVTGCRDSQDYTGNCDRGYSSAQSEWKEARVALPTSAPRPENLVRIYAPETTPGHEYAVDRTTIELGSDKVMRYTVAIRSDSGALNVFREGMRCETRQVYTYGYMPRAGAGFRELDGDWKPIALRGVRAYQDYLYKSIMCDRTGWPWSEAKAVQQIDAQYTAGGVLVERFCGDQQDCNRVGSRF